MSLRRALLGAAFVATAGAATAQPGTPLPSPMPLAAPTPVSTPPVAETHVACPEPCPPINCRPLACVPRPRVMVVRVPVPDFGLRQVGGCKTPGCATPAVGTAPPTVVLFVNHPSIFEATYQRYLLNVFREKLPFHDVPIKLYLRARSQTDPNAPSSHGDDPLADSGPRAGRAMSQASQGSASRHMNREVNELLAEIDD